jgi:RecG-like helicase
MIVEHAERFGLSQLHQLRGRVGRGAEKSFCVLLTTDKKTVVAQERLGHHGKDQQWFCHSRKGPRTPWAWWNPWHKQSGLPEFRIGNLVRDQAILEKARVAAEHYVTEKATSPQTQRMIKYLSDTNRYGLASIGWDVAQTLVCEAFATVGHRLKFVPLLDHTELWESSPAFIVVDISGVPHPSMFGRRRIVCAKLFSIFSLRE